MIKNIITAILIFCGFTMAQENTLANRLYKDYQNYKETSLTKKRFKVEDILPLINSLKDKNIFTVKKAGVSAQGRDIYLISAGTGPVKIFLWSQMHGDESTATMALFDIFNFLTANDAYNDFRKELLEKTTLYFMPMVNPDGANVFSRRDDFDIDINRDAARQQTPEGRVLKETFDSLKADFGFNLHDQSTLYSAGHSFRSAALSFLAPATNYEKTVNDVRKKAMQVIGKMFRGMSDIVPGHIAKYNDDFEPRAFGDNFQRWGTSTILIESGGWKNDPEKQFLRKLNFVTMLDAFGCIADKSYEKIPLETYEEIPLNEKDLMDLIVRNVTFEKDGYKFKIDIGIVRNEENTDSAKSFYYRSAVEDLGDLSVYYGYDDFDFSGSEIYLGKTYPKVFSSLDDIKKLDFEKLYSEGYTNVRLDADKRPEKFTGLPINIITNGAAGREEELRTGASPNFIIKKDGKISYVIINGFLHDTKNDDGRIINGIVF